MAGCSTSRSTAPRPSTGLDVLREAGAYRTVVTRSVPVTVSNGRLELAFTPTAGEAVVSNIAISKQ